MSQEFKSWLAVVSYSVFCFKIRKCCRQKYHCLWMGLISNVNWKDSPFTSNGVMICFSPAVKCGGQGKWTLCSSLIYFSGLEPQSPPKAPARKAPAGPTPLSSCARLNRNEDELDPTCAAATLKLIRDKLPKLTPPQARLFLFKFLGSIGTPWSYLFLLIKKAERLQKLSILKVQAVLFPF